MYFTFDPYENTVTVTCVFQISELQLLNHYVTTNLVQAINIIHIDYCNNIIICTFNYVMLIYPP